VRAGDWSLILFTLLTKTVVGAFVALAVVHWRMSRAGERKAADGLARRSLPLLGCLLVLAAMTSLAHLGNPLRASYSLDNLATSWLSREVLLVCLVAGCGAILGLMLWRSWGSRSLRCVLAALTAAFGLALIFAMSRVYMLATVPPWDRFATPLAFFSTTALLGVLTVTALLATFGRETGSDVVRRLLCQLPLALLGLLGLRLVSILVAALPVAGEPVSSPALWAPALQAALLVIAAVVLWAARGRARSPTFLVVLAILLVSGAELLGTVLFFASYWRVGV
jgi:anaerobic dimethyl sulfoxide reductase subunit C (anchor subunit)